MKLLKLVPEDTNIKFLKWRGSFYVFSMLLMAASWTLVMTKGLNYGVDFAGGQEGRLTFEDRAEAPIPELRELVAGLGYGEPVIQRFGDANQRRLRRGLTLGEANIRPTPKQIGRNPDRNLCR